MENVTEIEKEVIQNILNSVKPQQMNRVQYTALQTLLESQLEHIQRVINDLLRDRYKTGDEFFYAQIEKWSERETQVRIEISELNKYEWKSLK